MEWGFLVNRGLFGARVVGSAVKRCGGGVNRVVLLSKEEGGRKKKERKEREREQDELKAGGSFFIKVKARPHTLNAHRLSLNSNCFDFLYSFSASAPPVTSARDLRTDSFCLPSLDGVPSSSSSSVFASLNVSHTHTVSLSFGIRRVSKQGDGTSAHTLQHHLQSQVMSSLIRWSRSRNKKLNCVGHYSILHHSF